MKKCVLIIALICAIFCSGCNDVKYNNYDAKDVLITKEYSKAQVENLILSNSIEPIMFSDFKKTFKPECIRKTHQGYYVVLLQDDGKNVFVFFDEQHKVWNISIMGEFKTKKDFDDYISENTTRDDIEAFDDNYVPTHFSARICTINIVQEGVYVIFYSSIENGEMLSSPVVEEIRFYENDSLPTNEYDYVQKAIPFILKIDKQP